MDARMEVDGRVGDSRGNVYISKRISTWAGYTTIISDYVTGFMRDCVYLLRKQCLTSYFCLKQYFKVPFLQVSAI